MNNADPVKIDSVSGNLNDSADAVDKAGESETQQNLLLSFYRHKNLSMLGVFVFLVISFFGLSTLNAHKAEAAACNATTTGNWSVGSNWTGCTGAGGVPASTDTITINQGVTITADSGTMTVAGLTIATGAGANGLSISTGQLVTVNGNLAYTANANTVNQTITLNGTGSLTVTGTFTMPAPTSSGSSLVTCAASATGTLSVGSTLTMSATNAGGGDVKITGLTCTIDVTGLVTMTGSATASNTAIIDSTTGTLWFRGGLTFAGTAAQTQLTTTGAGTIKFAGTMNNSGTVSINAATTLEITANATLNKTVTWGNVTITSGTLTLGIAQTVAGNWTNNSASNALTGNFVVTKSGTSKTIGGSFSTSFYGLSIANGSTTTLNTSCIVGAGNFSYASGSAATTFTHASGIDLTVNGNASVTQPTGAVTKNWLINAGTATVTGTTTIGSNTNTASRIAKITITTGTANFADLTFKTGTTDVQVANAVLDVSGGAGTVNISGTITRANLATITPGTTSTINFTGSAAQTIPMGTASNTFWGACTTQCYANLTILNTNASGATLGNTVSSGNITGNLTIGNGSVAAIFNNGGFAITGTAGDTFQVTNNATFNMTGTSTYPTGFSTYTYGATSTVNYKQTSGLTVTDADYGHLGLVPAGASALVLPNATILIAGNLTIGNGTNAGATGAANNPTVTVTGNVTIGNGATYTSGSGTLTVGGTNFTETGTGVYTASTGNTVVFDNASNTVIVDGGTGDAIGFYNLTVSTAGKNVRFIAGETTTISGALTVSSGGSNVTFDTSSGASTWTIAVAGAQSGTITNLTVTRSGCSASPTITTGAGSTDGGSNGPCWVFAVNRTFSGVLNTFGGSPDATVRSLKWSKNGAAANTISTTVTTGAFTFDSTTTNGDIFTIWVNGEAVKGALVVKYGDSCTGTPNCTGLSITEGSVTLSNYHTAAFTNTELGVCDSDAGTGCNTADINYNVSSGALTTANDGLVLLAGSYTPGGTVTIPAAAGGSSDGQLSVGCGTTLTMGGYDLSVGSSFSGCGTLSVNSGQITTFTSTGTGNIVDLGTGNFYNLVFNGSGGGWSFSDSNVVINGDITMTLGTLSDSDSTVTVYGGDVTGNGDINFSGSSVFYLQGTGNFGGTTAWDFNALNMTNAGTTTATSSGSITTSTLTVDSSHNLTTSTTWILTGTGTPFNSGSSGTLNLANSIFRYTGNGATIASSSNGGNSITYHVLEAQPSSSTAQTIGTGAGHTINVNGVFVVGNSTNAGASGATYNPTINAAYLEVRNGATYTTGTGTLSLSGCVNNTFDRKTTGVFTATSGNTVTFTCTNTAGLSNLLSSAMTSGNSFYNLTIDGDGGGDNFPLGQTAAVTNNLTVSAGDNLTGTADLTVNGVVGGTGVVNLSGGTFTHNSTSSKNFGDTGNWTFNNLTLSGASGTTAANNTSNITVAGTLTVNSGHTLNAGSKTWILSSCGYSNSGGTFTAQTSTVSYRCESVIDIPGENYNHIDFSPASAAFYNMTGTFNVAGNFTLGGAGNIVLDLDDEATLDVNGDVIIGSGDTFQLSAGRNVTVGGSWTNSGTFTDSDGTITFDATGSGKNITSGTTNGRFNNITFNGVGGGWTLLDNPSIVNTLTIANGNLDASSRSIFLEASGTPFVKTGGTFTQGTSTVIYNGAAATNILALNGASTTDAYYNLYVGEAVDSNSVTYTMAGATTVNNQITVSHASATGTDTLVANVTLTLKGSTTPLNFVPGKGVLSSSYYSGSKFIFSSASGTAALSTIDLNSGANSVGWLDINGTGTFNVGDSIDLLVTRFTVESGTLAGSNNNISVENFVEGGGDVNLTGGTFTYLGGSYFNTGNTADWDFYNLVFGDGVASVSPYTQGTADIDVANQMVITTNTNFSPQSGYSKVFNLNSAGTPFVINGTLTPSDTTFNYNGAGATNIAPATYFNLGIKPGANSATHTFSAGSFTVGGNLVLGNGSNTGVVVNASAATTLDINGAGTSFDLKANTSFTAPSAMSVAGSWSDVGTFTHNSGTVTFDASSGSKTITSTGSSFNNVIFNNASGGWSPSDAMTLAGDLTMTAGTLSGTAVNVTVGGGDVTGNGDINFSGSGTFTVNGAGNFGGNNNWDFYNLAFGSASIINSIGSGYTVITGQLSTGVSSTFNAGSKSWSFSGSGTPFTVGAGASIDLGTSTFIYGSASGVTQLSNTPMTSGNRYYNLQINSANQTFNAGVDIEAYNAITVTAGTLALGSNNLTICTDSQGDFSENCSLNVASGASLTQNTDGATVLYSSIGDSCIAASLGSCSGAIGTVTLGNVTIPSGKIYSIGTTVGGNTVSMNSLDITNSTFTLNNNTLNLLANGNPLAGLDFGGNLVEGTSTVNFESAGTSGTTIPATEFYNLTVNKASNTFTAAGAITAYNNFTISAGTFVAPSSTLTVVNDFTNNGTFTHNNGTVDIDPTSKDVVYIGGASNTTFYNLLNNNYDTTMRFSNGRTIAINGTWTATGASGKLISIESDNPGIQWLVDVNGTADIRFAKVKDSGCSSSADILTAGRKIFNLGNNGTCWKFILLTAGNGGSGGGPGSGGSGGGGGGQGGGGSNTQATATANMQSGGVDTVTVNNGGAGYFVAPLVCFGGGSPSVTATATATVSGGAVTAINVTANGSGYQSTPNVVIGAPGSSGGSCGSGGGGGGSGGGGGGSP